MARSKTSSAQQTGHNLFKAVTKTKPVKDSAPDPRPSVRAGEHGRYQIKSGQLAGEFVARAFPKAASKMRGLIAEARADTEAAALAALHEAIDERESRRVETRRVDEASGDAILSVDEFVEAISQIAITPPQRAILLALALAGPEGMSEARIAYAGSYKSQPTAKRSFTAVGRAIATYYALESSSGSAGADGMTLMGRLDDTQPDTASPVWILHPEFCEAIRLTL